MSYVNLSEILAYTRERDFAVGAFNIFNQLTAEAAIRAAEEANVPIILQTSASTVKKLGAKMMFDYLRPLMDAASVPVALHLDHSVDVDQCKLCLDTGWSSVMYDGSRESYEVNAKNTKSVVDYAVQYSASVEGEIGSIVGVEDHIVVESGDAAIADPKTAIRFAHETGITALAPAIGTAHGQYTSAPRIRYEVFEEIAKECPCYLVIHGGTGLEASVFRRLIAIGAAKINVSTALKHAYIDGFTGYYHQHTDEYNPLRVDAAAFQSVKAAVALHISMFTKEGGR